MGLNKNFISLLHAVKHGEKVPKRHIKDTKGQIFANCLQKGDPQNRALAHSPAYQQ